MEYYGKLRQKIVESDLTQAEVAEGIGVAASDFSAFMRGKNWIKKSSSHRIKLRIAKFLGCTVSEIFDDDETFRGGE